jgi:hypothetical protein
MERAKIIQYVRIAVTALSLTACVLLIALWVRSYWQQFGIYRVYGNTGMSLFLASNDGIVLIPIENHRLFQRSAAPRAGSFDEVRYIQCLTLRGVGLTTTTMSFRISCLCL